MTAAERVPMRTLPVWVGTEDLFALQRSGWQGYEWRGAVMRGGVSLSLPSARVNERDWATFLFENEALGYPAQVFGYDSLGYTIPHRFERRLSATMFTARFGHDRLFGREEHPHSFVGLGFGLGSGSVSDPAGDDPDPWFAYELLVRSGAYAYPYRRARIGVVAQGVLGYRMIDSWRRGMQNQVLLGLVLESPLEIPRRFSAGQ